MEEITITASYEEDTLILTNKKGETFKSESQELMEFISNA